MERKPIRDSIELKYEIVRLRFFCEMGVCDIARHLGITHQYVSQVLISHKSASRKRKKQ